MHSLTQCLRPLWPGSALLSCHTSHQSPAQTHLRPPRIITLSVLLTVAPWLPLPITFLYKTVLNIQGLLKHHLRKTPPLPPLCSHSSSAIYLNTFSTYKGHLFISGSILAIPSSSDKSTQLSSGELPLSYTQGMAFSPPQLHETRDRYQSQSEPCISRALWLAEALRAWNTSWGSGNNFGPLAEQP